MKMFHLKSEYFKLNGTYEEDVKNTYQEIAKEENCDLEITEISEHDYLLSLLPEEFRGPVGYMAYERGHSAGDAEILNILRGLVYDLKDVIAAYGKRMAGK